MNTGTGRNGEGKVNAVRQDSQIVPMRGRQAPKQENGGGGGFSITGPFHGTGAKKERKNGRR